MGAAGTIFALAPGGGTYDASGYRDSHEVAQFRDRLEPSPNSRLEIFPPMGEKL